VTCGSSTWVVRVRRASPIVYFLFFSSLPHHHLLRKSLLEYLYEYFLLSFSRRASWGGCPTTVLEYGTGIQIPYPHGIVFFSPRIRSEGGTPIGWISCYFPNGQYSSTFVLRYDTMSYRWGLAGWHDQGIHGNDFRPWPRPIVEAEGLKCNLKAPSSSPLSLLPAYRDPTR